MSGWTRWPSTSWSRRVRRRISNGPSALYHDELMAGLDLDGCPDFELWLVSQRETWRARVTAALGRLVEHCASRDAFQAGADWAARLLAIEPWHEEAHRQRMWLLACAGQRSAALVQYDTCRRLLAETLGVAPAPETEAMVARIRAGDVERHVATGTRPLISPHPHNLPIQLTAFLGRAPELATIAERLANPECRLLTLVGPGGTGKTRLALEAGAAQVRAFADGAFFVPLAALESIDLLANEIADAIGLALAEPQEPRAQLLAALRGRHVLLVLDNFEHLLDGTALLLDILRAAPDVKLLVTSRERLNYTAEWLIHVQGLPFPLNGAPGGAATILPWTCSPSGPRTWTRASCSTARRCRTWRRSAGWWRACRWRSSWHPPGPATWPAPTSRPRSPRIWNS